jgi:hypothetical protein
VHRESEQQQCDDESDPKFNPHAAPLKGKCVRFVTPNNAGVWKFRRLQDTAGPVNLNRAKVVEERK